MDGIDNQQNVDYRSQLRDRAKTWYPDRNFDSENGQDSPNSLEQSLVEKIAEYEASIKDLTDKNTAAQEREGRVSQLFKSSPRSATFLNTLASTGNPGAAIFKAYGRGAYDAYKSGDASELIAQIEADDAKKRAEDEQLQAQKTANINNSLAELDTWGNEKGLSDDDKIKTFMRFYDILCDAEEGKYSRELFEMAWKADHYDGDVETARREGEVTGRNDNIRAKTRQRQTMQSMPPSLAGQGVRASDSQPSREDDPWMLG